MNKVEGKVVLNYLKETKEKVYWQVSLNESDCLLLETSPKKAERLLLMTLSGNYNKEIHAFINIENNSLVIGLGPNND